MTTKVLIAIVVCSILSLAARANSEEIDSKPVFSALGIKRAQENLKILDQNIRDMKANAETADRNAQTLRDELAELDKLDQEHREMRARCQEYLDNAKVQFTKNEGEIKKALVNERNLARATTGDKQERLAQMEKVRRDKAELENWKGDAQSKLTRVKALLGEIAESERQIELRRASLKGQVRSWQARKEEFNVQIEKFSLRRAEAEKLIEK